MKLEPANIICPICGNGNYMRHLSGKGIGLLDVKCINCNSYFSFEELYKQRKEGRVTKYICDNCEKYPCDDTEIKLMKYCPVYSPKPKPITNADRIRAMTDEELAAMFDIVFDPWCDARCKDGVEISCRDCILEWLKKESE